MSEQMIRNFANKFESVERVAAQKLRQRIKELKNNHLQMMKEMNCYKELLARKNVNSEMQFEK